MVWGFELLLIEEGCAVDGGIAEVLVVFGDPALLIGRDRSGQAQAAAALEGESW
jgi:hypothetical protein